jgi:hypothetical protein
MTRASVQVLTILLLFGGNPAAAIEIHADPESARLVTEDIDRFWQAVDEGRANGDLAGSLRRLYFEPASPGLRDFIDLRIGSTVDLAAVVESMPKTFDAMRPNTLRVAEMEPAIRAALYAMEYLFPQAVYADVTFVIGRLGSGGTTSHSGLLIGVDMYGLTEETPPEELNDWLREVLKPIEDIPHIVAHELVHFQQADLPAERRDLLAACFREGSADFVAELISGRHINEHVHAWALPREHEIWQKFEAAMDQTETSGWLYGGQPEGWPADVGYFVGYRIAQAYYEKAEDPRRALAEILLCEDVHALLAASGYAP